MHLLLILFIVLVILVILGLGVTNLAVHIAKFLYFVLFLAVLGLLIYGYIHFYHQSDTPSLTEPVTPPVIVVPGE